jgi:Synergist-CTERM protein sorting domain-containing protein
VLDQTAITGFRNLGEFELVAGVPAAVTLGDNTGEAYDANAKIAIMFDAVRVLPMRVPPGGGEEPGEEPGDAGGCSTGTGAGGWLVLALVPLVRRRRR